MLCILRAKLFILRTKSSRFCGVVYFESNKKNCTFVFTVDRVGVVGEHNIISLIENVANLFIFEIILL